VEVSNPQILNGWNIEMKKFYTVKVVERDAKDMILDEYEVGCWDILTNTFAESVFKITERFVESMNSDTEVCENVVEQLLEMKKKNIFT
jgi:hypothetical protein